MAEATAMKLKALNIWIPMKEGVSEKKNRLTGLTLC